jgi:hypothetical protein
MRTDGKKTDFEPVDANDHESMCVSALDYGALSDLRGLQTWAHFLVMTATRSSGGSYTLTGQAEAFDALANDLSDEITHELSPRNRLRHLARVYNRLRPDDLS